MTAWPVASLLLLLVTLVWLATAGFLRLRTPYDRMHCVSLINGAGGLLLLFAVLAGDGVSDRSGKILLLVALALIGGAVTSHAIGRALQVRGSAPEVD